MKRFYLLLMLFTTISLSTSAQIGYQVSLLNNATGEPRANELVTVTVKITNSKGTIVCEETKNETSNDFGIVSMSVGDSKTFDNADWSKLPFFIEASVDGRLLGKSQLLSVPVAEYAKRTGSLTVDLLCSKKWIEEEDYDDDGTPDTFIFKEDGSYTFHRIGKIYHEGSYFIDGNEIHYSDKEEGKEYWGHGRSLIYNNKGEFIFDRNYSGNKYK